MLLRLTLLLLLIFLQIQAEAFPLTSKNSESVSNEQSLESVSAIRSDTDFEGIVNLLQCSGAMIRFAGSKPDDDALVLTNGHCKGAMPEPGTFYFHEATNRNFYLFGKQGKAGTIHANLIVYATMTGTDILLYQLDESFAEIEKRLHVRPLLLASEHPVVGQASEVVSGYTGTSSACKIEQFVPGLKEARWTFHDSIRYTQGGCKLGHGSSGAPLIDLSNRSIIGIHNTHNDDGEMCSMNNPCEVDGDGNTSVVADAAYGQQTYLIYSCLNNKNEFDLRLPGCKLLHSLNRRRSI